MAAPRDRDGLKMVSPQDFSCRAISAYGQAPGSYLCGVGQFDWSRINRCQRVVLGSNAERRPGRVPCGQAFICTTLTMVGESRSALTEARRFSNTAAAVPWNPDPALRRRGRTGASGGGFPHMPRPPERSSRTARSDGPFGNRGMLAARVAPTRKVSTMSLFTFSFREPLAVVTAVGVLAVGLAVTTAPVQADAASTVSATGDVSADLAAEAGVWSVSGAGTASLDAEATATVALAPPEELSPLGANDCTCVPTAAHPDPVILVPGTF